MADTGEDWFAAARSGDAYTLTALLNQEIDVNAFDDNGMTALHQAAWNVWPACVRLLLDHGADANADNDNRPGWRGWTPLMCAIDAPSGGDSGAENSNVVLIVHLLLDNGADPNVRYVSTALELAEAEELREVARLLRQAGATE